MAAANCWQRYWDLIQEEGVSLGRAPWSERVVWEFVGFIRPATLKEAVAQAVTD